jgi:hypothetical protein
MVNACWWIHFDLGVDDRPVECVCVCAISRTHPCSSWLSSQSLSSACIEHGADIKMYYFVDCYLYSTNGHRGVIGQRRACMLQENQVPSAVYDTLPSSVICRVWMIKTFVKCSRNKDMHCVRSEKEEWSGQKEEVKPFNFTSLHFITVKWYE